MSDPNLFYTGLLLGFLLGLAFDLLALLLKRRSKKFDKACLLLNRALQCFQPLEHGELEGEIMGFLGKHERLGDIKEGRE